MHAKLVTGWGERIKLMKGIWEGPVQGIVSGTVCFVEEGKGEHLEGKINKRHKSNLVLDWEGRLMKGKFLRSYTNINTKTAEETSYPFNCKIRALLTSKTTLPSKKKKTVISFVVNERENILLVLKQLRNKNFAARVWDYLIKYNAWCKNSKLISKIFLYLWCLQTSAYQCHIFLLQSD